MTEYSEKFDNDDEIVYVSMSVHDLKILDRYVESALRHLYACQENVSDSVEWQECRDRLKFLRSELEDVWTLNQERIQKQREERKRRWTL